MKQAFIIKPISKWSPDGIYGTGAQPKYTMLVATDLIEGQEQVVSLKFSNGVTAYKNLRELAAPVQVEPLIRTETNLPETVPAVLTIVYVTADQCFYYSDGTRWNAFVHSSIQQGGSNANLIKTIRSISLDDYAALDAAEKPENTVYISKNAPYDNQLMGVT